MNPTRMAEKPMFPTHRSNPSDGEPDAVKVARPVRRGGDGANQPEQSGHRRRRPYPMPGLIGMRERVSLFGGELDVGPATEGGFRVHASLPLEESR